MVDKTSVEYLKGYDDGFADCGDNPEEPEASAGELLDLLTLALPYVEEGEKFNKPNAHKLSSDIRALLKQTGD